MKVIVSESKLGIEYLADVISSCNQNGIECIVDDNAGEILYYLPKEGRYGDDKLLHNSDESIFDLVQNKERLVNVLRDAKGDEFKKFAVKWNGLQTKGEDEEVYKTDHCNPIRGNFSEGLDNPHDWSASEGEVEILWDTDEYEDFGIFKGEGSTYLIDYDRVDTHDDLINEVCRLIGKEYPDLDFDPSDFVIVNEDEFWEQRGGNPGKWQDEMYSEDSLGKSNKYDVEIEFTEGEDDVVEKIPNWATTYIMYGDASDNLTDEDIQMVDDFIDKLASQGISLVSPIEGTESGFESHPAFGDACDTTDWSCETSTVYESGESNKYDVEIEFTGEMGGREFKKGQKETVTIDLADMPKTYNIDRLKYEIARIISDTLPGKGHIPWWRFKVLDEEDLIKAVMGDNYKPLKLDDIPDEMTFDEAMDYYNDLYDAYYDHRIKYDKLRDICKTLKDAVVKNLLKTSSIEELGREWFKDYGTMNGWDAKTSFEYGVADALHEIHKKKYPEEHKVLPQRHNWRGWHEDNCSCGLCSSSDSSD